MLGLSFIVQPLYVHVWNKDINTRKKKQKQANKKVLFTDAVAYAALLRNELLGAGIETVPDPHTDDRQHTILTQDTHSLFRVSPLNTLYKFTWHFHVRFIAT